MQTPLKSKIMEREMRTVSLHLRIALRLDRRLLHRFGDFVLEFLTGLLELTHAATETAGKFRELLGSKKKKNRKEDQEPFLSAGHAEG